MRFPRYSLKLLQVIIIALTSICSLQAQPHDYQVQYLGDNYGLGPFRTRGLIESKWGLWIFTSDQLYLFDGVSTQTFNHLANNAPLLLPNGQIANAALDERSNLWVTTSFGTVILDGGKRVLVDVKTYPAALLAIFPHIQTVFNGEKEELYLLAQKRLYLFKQNTLQDLGAFETDINPVYNFFAYDKKYRRVFFNDPNNVAHIWEKGKGVQRAYTTYKSKLAPLESTPLSKHYYTFVDGIADSVTTLWLPGLGRILWKDPTDGQVVWARGYDDLSNHFTPWKAVIDYVKQPDSPIPSSFIKDIMPWVIRKIDPSTWAIGTNSGVFLVKTRPKKFHHIKETDGYSVRGITELPNKHLLFGTYSGLFEHTGTHTRMYDRAECQNIWDFYVVNNDSVWTAAESPDGIVLLSRQKEGFRPASAKPSSPSSFDKCLAPSPWGLWSGQFTDRLVVLDPVTGQSRLFRYDSTSGSEIKTMIYSNKTGLWVGSKKGIQHFLVKNKNEPPILQPHPTLPTLVANALYEDQQGSIWMGSLESGLYKFNPLDNSLRHWTTADGLPHNTIYTILGSSGDAVLWLGTQNGLCRMLVPTEQFHTFYQSDGLGQSEFNSGSAYQSPQGVYYFGGINGVSWFRPEEVAVDTLQHIGYAYAIITNSATQRQRQVPLFDRQSLTVYSEEPIIEIHFRSNNLFLADQSQCRYAIEGIHKQWQVVPADEKLLLTGLKPGNYVLKYQVRPLHGSWSTVCFVHIEVRPPWYQSFWFYLFLAALTGLVLFLIYRSRINQLKKTYELRKSVTDDLHDTLGSRLYLLKQLASKIVQQEGQGDKVLIELFEYQAMEALQSVRSLIWAFDPKNDNITALIERLHDFIQNYLQPIVPHIDFKSATGTAPLKISPKEKHHTLQIYQELLTNMVKHTHIRSLNVHVATSTAPNKLTIRIENEHSGMKGAHPEESLQMGQDSIRQRLRSMGAELNWETPNNECQVATIVIPL